MHNDSAQLKPQRGKDPVLADSGETLDINNNQQDCYSVPGPVHTTPFEEAFNNQRSFWSCACA